MKIIQMSDFHIDDSFNITDHNKMLNKLLKCIENDMADEEHIYILCCGDIVNKGNADGYIGKAKEFIDYISDNIKGKKIEWLFVPGNHDLCDKGFDKFQKFIEQYNDKINFVSENVVLYNGTEINFILINSCYHKDYQYGNIDIEALENVVKKTLKPSLVVMHHTLLSRYSDDRSAINDAYKFLNVLEKNNIIGILHGHTHGYSNIVVGEKCRIVGVGSLFAYIPNCNNQFNIIDIRLGKIERIINYRYNFDLENFITVILFEDLKRNHFESSKISTVYNEVRKTVEECGGINNLYMNVDTSIDDYKNDMEKHFKADIDTARLWLEEKVPPSLYYNHGQYMVDSRNKGISYIIDELIRNSTSNRAIIPLVRFSDVLDKQFDYLPGLNSIQFGFINDEKAELYCSVYLRSLEVNYFLRINLSEIYILLTQLCDQIRSVKRLLINIYAFKAQYKEKFSCFRKAQIDVLNIGLLSKYVFEKNISEIVQLLTDKFEMEETVINTKGLNQLYDILQASELYNNEMITGLKEIIEDMEKLKQEYLRSSNYKTIQPIEKKIHSKQEQYIKLFSSIKS